MSTLTDGITIVTPQLILGYETSRQSRNVVHQVIGRADPDVTLREASLRRGTLELFFLTEAAAASCATMHARPATFTLVESTFPLSNMRYVLDGNVARKLDPATMLRWIVAVDYQEIAP